ncbi:hypothetical protein GQ55_7G079700 [Panicum hallii var. hallii]|uniref:Uncharacterized protein n=1 Tax=Panicum hallii var. hallii TaxID=1504633 RepID=A0A2T7CSZ4_9POAL|nr:hypothetical protein GQ55_7G079700 [Panicum hallii var. hallii]
MVPSQCRGSSGCGWGEAAAAQRRSSAWAGTGCRVWPLAGPACAWAVVRGDGRLPAQRSATGRERGWAAARAWAAPQASSAARWEERRPAPS